MRPGTTSVAKPCESVGSSGKKLYQLPPSTSRKARLPSTLVHFHLPRIVARRLITRRLDRNERRREVAQLLQLVALVQEADHLVAAIELEGALERVVVGQLGAREDVAAERGLVLVVQAIAIEEPRLLLPQRSADVEVDVVLLVDRVAAVERRAAEEPVLVALVRGAERIGHVVADGVFAEVIAVPVAGESIAAGLDGDGQVRAATDSCRRRCRIRRPGILRSCRSRSSRRWPTLPSVVSMPSILVWLWSPKP